MSASLLVGLVVIVGGLVLLAVFIWRFESRYRRKPPADRQWRLWR